MSERAAPKRIVAVIGAGDCSSEEAATAFEVGRLLALRSAVVICGGLGGVMEAACRGAKEAGGTTIGILPGSDPSAANPFVDIPIATGMGELRNFLVVRTAEAVIAIGGEFGTLSEIGMALKLGKRVVGLGTWELAKCGEPADAILRAATADEAVELALG